MATRSALKTRIIPALDVTGGRVVKGIEFQNLRDAGDPVELAARYDREGADEIVFLDISATAENRNNMIDVVERTANQVFIPLTVGGGVRSVADMRALLSAGADKIFLNSAAVAEPSLVSDGAEIFGQQCMVVAVDARRDLPGDRWQVYTRGGRTPTGRDVVEWVREVERRGAGEILLTSMNQDGTGGGYDLALLEAASAAVNVPVIASGGAGTLDHLVEALQPGRADAVLAASIFHFGTYTIRQAKTYLRDHGIPVRLESDPA